MKLFALVKKFRADEAGAVTVDWVVLTAAVVALGFAAMNTVSGGISTAATSISTAVSGVTVSTGQ
ncbi:MAG: hypothetical protein KGI94_06035 [Paracoccaceae bacterium]|nr:hypothetical protein [Paracoccaceae bacterium]MDE3121290.1 hypothetical protein [Paracoccaceae bacterium]MDE3237831.1 hypothetical protein [Paracoccaceae bacterium]